MHPHNVIIAVCVSWLLTMINDSTDATVIGISLEGCYKNLSHFTTSLHLSDKNGPRLCFDECKNSEYIGLQEKNCICNATRGAYATERDCNTECPGERNVSCGSVNTIYVYSKVQTNISVSGEFGFVYLHVYKAASAVLYTYEISGTNDITEKHSYICYDESSKCHFEAVVATITWLDAKADCLLKNQGVAPYHISIEEAICTTSILDGYYWIGMIWSMPVSTTTISTTSKIATMQTTTTIRKTATMTTETSTKIKNATVASSIAPPVQPTSSYKATTLIAVSVICSVILIATVVSVVICYWKKMMCFKQGSNRKEGGVKTDINQEQKNVEMDKINNNAPLEIPVFNTLMGINALSSVPPGSTLAPFHGHPENHRPITARQRDIQGRQYARVVSSSDISDKNMGSNTQNHLEDIDVKSVSSHVKKEEGIKSDMKRGEKEKGKIKRKEKKKDKHRVSVDKEYEEIEANTENHAENLNSYINDDLSAVNERTGYPNGESKDKEKKIKKTKKKHKKEYSYSDEERTNTSDEPGTVVDSEPHSRRPIATASPLIRVTVASVQDNMTDNIHPSDEVHNELNDNNNDTRTDKKKRRERSREKLKEKLANGYCYHIKM